MASCSPSSSPSRCSTRASSVCTRCSQPTSGDRGLDRGPPRRLRHTRVTRSVIVAAFGPADRGLGGPWPVSQVSTAQVPDPLMGVAREEEGTRPNGRITAGPAGLDHCLGLRASARGCASVAVGLGAEVLPAGSARLPTVLPLRARHECDLSLAASGKRGRCGWPNSSPPATSRASAPGAATTTRSSPPRPARPTRPRPAGRRPP